ncbi:MAG: DUF4336 domain-containing protein [Deltaproteobacteria bacterium]
MTGYEPLQVLKPVAQDIWVVDGPKVSFYGMPFSTRMSVIRLPNGDLFLHSPIALTDDLAKAVTALGPVRHLVSPNWIHYAGMRDWQVVFPDAITWASPNVRERAAKHMPDLRFDRDLGEQAEADWANEIDQIIVHGSKVHVEVVFFHLASATLILTDLIENFEARNLPVWFRPLAWLAGVLDPNGHAPLDMRMTFRYGRDPLRAAVTQMLAWEPARVILAHGRWYDSNGIAELRRAFQWALK